MNEAKTWEVVERLVGVNVVDLKWVFWLKKVAEGKNFEVESTFGCKGVHPGVWCGLFRNLRASC